MEQNIKIWSFLIHLGSNMRKKGSNGTRYKVRGGLHLQGKDALSARNVEKGHRLFAVLWDQYSYYRYRRGSAPRFAPRDSYRRSLEQG